MSEEIKIMPMPPSICLVSINKEYLRKKFKDILERNEIYNTDCLVEQLIDSIGG